MSVAVSQDLARSQIVAEVFSGRQTRAIRPNTSATEKPQVTEIQQGTGIKSSAAAMSLLDESRRAAMKSLFQKGVPSAM